MVKNQENTKEYGWGDNCKGFYFLESPGFNIKVEKIPTGSTTSMHYHKGMTQFFYVRSGTLSIDTAEQTFVLKPGEGIELTGNKKHRVHNAHEVEVEYLVAERYGDDCKTYYD